MGKKDSKNDFFGKKEKPSVMFFECCTNHWIWANFIGLSIG